MSIKDDLKRKYGSTKASESGRYANATAAATAAAAGVKGPQAGPAGPTPVRQDAAPRKDYSIKTGSTAAALRKKYGQDTSAASVERYRDRLRRTMERDTRDEERAARTTEWDVASRLKQLQNIRLEANDLQSRLNRGSYAAASGGDDREALERELRTLTDPYGGLAGLERMIQEVERTQRRVEKYNSDMSLIRVNDPVSEYYDPEFDALSRADGAVTDARYRWINDEQYRPDAWAYTMQALTPDLPETVGNQERAQAWLAANGDPAAGGLAVSNLELMTADEVATYNYHYAKGGAEQAQRYLDAINDSLNQRKARQIYEGLEGKTAKELAFGFRAGYDQFMSGVKGMRSDKELPVSATQYASGMVREDLKDRGAKLPDWMGGASLAQVGFDAITTTSNMAPSILASAVTNAVVPGAGSWVGLGTMSGGAAGGAKQEALRAGYSAEQATAYGIMVGAAEAGMEKILGGISKLGGKGLGGLTDKLTGGKFTGFLNNLDNAFLRVSAEMGEKMLSEGTEEYVQEIIDPLLRNAALGEENELALYTPEALYSGLLGAITGGVMEGIPTIRRNVEESRQRRAETEAADAEDSSAVDKESMPTVSKTEMVEPADPVEMAMRDVDDLETDHAVPGRTIEEAAAEFGEQAGAATKYYESGQDVESYVRGFRAAYDMGRSGVRESYAVQSGATQGLTEHQRKMAWLTGKGAAALEAQRASEALPAGKSDTWRKGSLRGVGITTKDISKAFNVNQKSAYKTMAFYAEAAGVDVVAYVSEVDEATGKLVGPTIDGVDLSDANGAFCWKNDKIYIDLNAGIIDGKQMADVNRYTALRTFGHEFTHFVEKWNPEGYSQLRETAFDALTRQGVDVDSLIAEQMSKDKSLDYDQASREVVAEAMTDILRDANFAQDLAVKNGTVFEKIRSELKKLVKRIRSYFSKINPNQDPGAKALQQELEGGMRYLDEIVELYDKVAMEAAERHQTALARQKAAEQTTQTAQGDESPEAEGPINAENTTAVGDGVQMEIREIGDTGRFYVQADRQVLTGSDPHAWGKQMEQYINTVIRKEQDVAFPTKDGHVLLLTGRSAYKLKDRHVASIQKKVERFLTDEAFALKGRAATHIDELIQVARFDKYEPDRNQKHENDIGEDGFNYYDTYFKDFDGGYYQITLTAALNGQEETAYSIANIRKRRFPASPGSSSNQEALNSGRKPSGDIIYSSEGKSQEVKTAIRIAFEKAFRAKADTQAERSGPDAEDASYQRREGSLSDWEVLDRASDALGKEKLSQAEQDALAAFKGRLAKMEGLEAQRAEQGTIWHDNQFSEGGDREKARLARKKMRLLDDQLRQGYAELLSMEDKNTLQIVLKKARGVVQTQERQAANERVREFRLEQNRQHKTDIRTMEREFLRLVRAYEKSEAKADESEAMADARATSLREALDKIATLKADSEMWQKEFNRLLREYNKADKDIGKLEKLLERHKNLSKSRVEGRKKTALRHHIKDTVKELERLLLKGDKKRHIMEGMKIFVSKGLDAARVLFADSYSDEELVLNGIGTALTPEEKTLVKDTKALLEQKQEIVAGLASADEPERAKVQRLLHEERISVQSLDRKIAANMGELHGVLVRERARLNEAEVSDALTSLATAYHALGDSDDKSIRGAYDEKVHEHLTTLTKEIGGTPVRDMTLEQLTKAAKAYQMVLTTVRNANRNFFTHQGEELAQTATRAAEEITSNGKRNRLGIELVEQLKKFGINNLKPTYFFEHLNSEVLRELYQGLLKGQDQWATDVSEAREFYLEQAHRYGMKDWDTEKTWDFQAASGEHFKLNLGQIMSIYAYSRRDQALEHLRKGGIVVDSETKIQEVVELAGGKFKIQLKGKSTDATAYNIDEDTLAQITGKLTAEQKRFTEAMQDYLSDTMGAKGNEVSMVLYGIRQFTEQHYFPLKSAPQYMEKAREQQEQAGKIKNAGFTKATIKNASAPIILSSFMDVWADHVSEMSLYHAMTLPLEDLHRVYNYHRRGDGTVPAWSVEAAIQNAFGTQATGYMNQLLKDLNGGARTDNADDFMNKSMSLFKKGAVFLSASVAIQQPSAIARAMAMIDARYFVPVKLSGKWREVEKGNRDKKHDRHWAELKKYAPVAIIKEMGYFDANMGRSTRDFIQAPEYSGIREKTAALIQDSSYRDEKLSRIPALADEMAWCSIWEAVKREQHAKNKDMNVTSEEFLRLCGERFTEVIDKTQVYDSVLSRSTNMRSRSSGMRMATSFMAEPTTAINMVADAILKAKRGDKRFARRAVGAVMASNILNAVLVSLVYAARDDDEDKEYWERYLGHLTGEVWDSLNPATYVPLAQDILSIWQGWDVERADMAIFSDLRDAVNTLLSDKATTWEKTRDMLGATSQLFGLPLKNLLKDAEGLYRVGKDIVDGQDSTAVGIGYAVRAELPEWIGGGAVTNEDQLYEAILNGDKAHEERVRQRYKDKDGNIDEKKVTNARRKALRKNDSRVHEAAVYLNEGQLLEYYTLIAEIVDEGFFHKDDVLSAIESEASTLLEDTGAQTTPKHKSYFKAEHFAIAAASDDSRMMNTIKADLALTAMDNGKTQAEAEASAVSSIRGAVKEAFVEDGTVSEAQAVSSLMGWCDATEKEAADMVNEWTFEKQNGYPLSELEDVFVSGEVSADDAEGFLVSHGGYARVEAQSKVLQWQCEKDEGIRYSDVQQLYVDGKMTAERARELRVKYGESSLEDARKEVLKWDCEKDNGVKYSDIDVAYLSGDITEETAIDWLVKYGEKTQEKAELAVQAYRWRNEHTEYKDLGDDKIDRYIDFCQGAGVSIPDFYAANKRVSEIREAGGAQKENVVRYIRSLPLSRSQKWALWYAVKTKSWKDNVSF